MLFPFYLFHSSASSAFTSSMFTRMSSTISCWPVLSYFKMSYLHRLNISHTHKMLNFSAANIAKISIYRNFQDCFLNVNSGNYRGCYPSKMHVFYTFFDLIPPPIRWILTDFVPPSVPPFNTFRFDLSLQVSPQMSLQYQNRPWDMGWNLPPETEKTTQNRLDRCLSRLKCYKSNVYPSVSLARIKWLLMISASCVKWWFPSSLSILRR